MAVLGAMVLVGQELDPWVEGLEVHLEDLGAVPVACCLSAKGDGGPSCVERQWAMDDGWPLMTKTKLSMSDERQGSLSEVGDVASVPMGGEALRTSAQTPHPTKRRQLRS